MYFGKSSPFSVSILATLLLSACGGADIPSITLPVNLVDTGSQAVVTTGPAVDSQAATETTAESEPDIGLALPSIIGRLAGGSIVGATVCIDVNENGECDANEPSTVTASGGHYELTVLEDAEDKPMVAMIPADAINEDTGKPVGEALVLSAPAGQTALINPAGL